jgi:hypothetical protein
MLSWVKKNVTNGKSIDYYKVYMTFMTSGGDSITYKGVCDPKGQKLSFGNDSILHHNQLIDANINSSSKQTPTLMLHHEPESLKLSNYSFNDEPRKIRSSQERLTIIKEVTDHVCTRVRVDIKRCIQRRTETYKLAYTFIESIAENHYRIRSETDKKLIVKFKKNLKLCKVDNEQFYTHYQYLPHELALNWVNTPTTPIVTSKKKKKKKNRKKELQLKKIQEQHVANTIQKLLDYNPEDKRALVQPDLFERYDVLGQKLIAALGSDATNHVDLYKVILNGDLKKLSASLKTQINEFPYKAIMLKSKSKSKFTNAVKLFEAAVELDADFTLRDLVCPTFTPELIKKYDEELVPASTRGKRKTELLQSFQTSDYAKLRSQTLAKRTEMLKLLFKFPKYSPKTTKAKDDIAKLMSIALQRGEIPIVALLAQVNGIKPTLKDLLHPEYPINDVSHWEELIKHAIRGEAAPFVSDDEAFFYYVVTPVIWQLQNTQHPRMSQGDRRVSMIRYALDISNEEYAFDDTMDINKERLGVKMSELLMGHEENLFPWYLNQNRMFTEVFVSKGKGQEEEKRFCVNDEFSLVYCTQGMYNYITQAFVDGHVELIELYLQHGGCLHSRGHIDKRVFLQLQQEFPKMTNKYVAGSPGSFHYTMSEWERDQVLVRFKNLLRKPAESSKDLDWSTVGTTPLHLVLEMNENLFPIKDFQTVGETKEEREPRLELSKKQHILNAISTRCCEFIQVHEYYNKLKTEGGTTIQDMIDALENLEEKKEFQTLIKDTNSRIMESNRSKRQQKKKAKGKNKIKNKKGKKGQDKAVSRREKKERDQSYEKLIQELMLYEGKAMYDQKQHEKEQNVLRDPDVRPEHQAQRGHLKTLVRGGGGGVRGETKGETKGESKKQTKKKYKGQVQQYHESVWQVKDGGDGIQNCMLKEIESWDHTTWEINATDRMKKKMAKMAKNNKSRYRGICANIKKIAMGEFDTGAVKHTGNSICKPLHIGCPGLELYEMKIKTQNWRLYWEVKVDRSQRLNNDGSLNKDGTKKIKTSKEIFCEVIHLRRIGKKNEQKKDLAEIKRSFEKDVVLRREMENEIGSRGGRGAHGTRDKMGNRSPMIYFPVQREMKDGVLVDRGEHLMDQGADSDRIICTQGPAVCGENSFGMQLMYMIDSNFMASIMYSDFTPTIPITLDPEEQRLIALVPNPESSILLLGRSGTGKTTCLVYRIWNDFRRYWEGTGMAVQKNNSEQHQLRVEKKNSVKYKLLHQEDKEQQDRLDDEEELNNMQDHSGHYLFITKSAGLRWEIREQFRKIRETHYQAQVNKTLCKHPDLSFDQALELEPPVMPDDLHPTDPDKLIWSLNRHRPSEPWNHPGVPETKFPLFLAEHEWLHILDHTLPTIEGDDRGKRFKPFYNHHTEEEPEDSGSDFSEDDDEDGDDHDGSKKQTNKVNDGSNWFWDMATRPHDPNTTKEEEEESMKQINFKARQAGRVDKYVEITFDVFRSEFYPSFAKYNMKADAALVFSEIKSHIQGSLEALQTQNGRLSREQYVSAMIGKKRSRLETSERTIIYDFYKNEYLRIRDNGYYTDDNGQTLGYWDLGTVVFNLWYRFLNITKEDQEKLLPITEIFVDEVQDFTQAELALVMRLSKTPNNLFLAGDTAQNIEKGVSFRFQEIKTLFHELESQRKRAVAADNKKKKLEKEQREEQQRAREEEAATSNNTGVKPSNVLVPKPHTTPHWHKNNDDLHRSSSDNTASTATDALATLPARGSSAPANIGQEGETKEAQYSGSSNNNNNNGMGLSVNRGLISWSLTHPIQVPTESKGTFCTLTTNYRSHAGVLNLAGTVVELLYWKFALSLDKLPSDRGTEKAEGKRLPVIFRQGKAEELEVVLSGNPKGGKIDFGVAQAILCRTKRHTKFLPPGLKVRFLWG